MSSFALMAIMFLLNTATTTAQCSLACNASSQVSLDENGNALITPETLLNAEATSCSGGAFIVKVYEYGTTNEISTSPTVTCDYEGQTLTVGIWDTNSGNNCWGEISIEDKLPPVLACSSDTIVIGCAEIIAFTPVVTDNCDPSPTVTLISEVEESLDCDSLYIKRVTRVYQAEDNQGMKSLPCTMVFNLKRIELDSIVFPMNWDIAPGDTFPISCSTVIPLDHNGNPDPLYTGVPTLHGDSLWPNNSTFCNSATFYEDLVIPTVNCTKKIMRTWRVREWWCSQEFEASTVQIIEIMDTIGPDISCSNTINITTTPSGCDVNLIMPPATVSDDCSETVTVKMTYPGGFLESNGGLITLPVGTSVVTYTAYDECYNASSCTVEVNVIDHTPPVAVCIQYTTVSLTIGGEAWIPAASFDDGSFDECAIDRIMVKRMDDGENCNIPNTTFQESVPVCCNDIGEETLIIMRVWDKAGNYNECMVNVEVQDKLAPTIVCPDTLWVECQSYYNPEDLAATFGEATYYDNCEAEITETYEENFNACGIGSLTRHFTATDQGGRTNTCSQIIYFRNDSLFTFEDITWPANYDQIGCLDPATLGADVLGYPTYDEDQCDLVGANYEDEIFYFNQPDAPACFKIIRHWAVIDWCQFYEDVDGNVVYHVWRHDQIIKIINNVDPVITTSCEPVSTCTYDVECQDGYIELVSSASDDCTISDEMRWEYKIDLDRNGTFDYTERGAGSTANASGSYAIGSHSIAWIFYDKCGNHTTCVQDFDIVNCKAPTPYCLNGLAIDLMPMDTNNDGEPDAGMIETWASDFDHGSSHPCGYPVILSFEADTTVKTKIFTCADLGEQQVNLYVSVLTPTGLIQAWCETYVVIQDNMQVCGDDLVGGIVSGMVTTEDDVPVQNVSVELQFAESMTSSTNDAGQYSFPSMPLGGTYDIVPTKTDNAMDGVSTLDLILIQRHILKLKDLDTPFKMIAADINNDGLLNGSDLISLRRVILGKTDEFVNNTSWRFIDQGFSFEEENPLGENVPEEYSINQLSEDMAVDFIAVKTGDVNNTISDELMNISNDVRNEKTLSLETINQAFEAGDKVSVVINTAKATTLNGFQFTINFDNSSLTYEGNTTNEINIEDDNFGFGLIERGVITTSWNNDQALEIQNGDALFTLEFTAKKAGNIQDVVGINSSILTAEAYDANFNPMNIEFNAENAFVPGYELYQNTPNPFSEKTSISFDLPVSESVTLKMFDVTGRVLKVITDSYTAGTHSVVVDTKEINATGVVYYTLESKNFTSTKRMVILK